MKYSTQLTMTYLRLVLESCFDSTPQMVHEVGLRLCREKGHIVSDAQTCREEDGLVFYAELERKPARTGKFDTFVTQHTPSLVVETTVSSSLVHTCDPSSIIYQSRVINNSRYVIKEHELTGARCFNIYPKCPELAQSLTGKRALRVWFEGPFVLTAVEALLLGSAECSTCHQQVLGELAAHGKVNKKESWDRDIGMLKPKYVAIFAHDKSMQQASRSLHGRVIKHRRSNFVLYAEEQPLAALRDQAHNIVWYDNNEGDSDCSEELNYKYIV